MPLAIKNLEKVTVIVKLLSLRTDAVICLRLTLLGLLLLVGCKSESGIPNAKFLIGNQFDQTLIIDSSGAILRSIDMPVIEAKWSPDGKHIAFRGREYEVGVLNLETGETRSLWHSEASDLLPRLGWSPNGRYVAYADEDQDFHSRIYVFDLGGESITHNDWPCGKSCGSPVWQPDNESVVYVESLLHTADRQNFISHVNQLNTQTGITTTLFSPNHDTQAIRWSPDGQQLALLSRNYGVFIRNNSGTERQLPVSGMFDLCWLPDSRQLALTSFYPSSGHLYVEAHQLATGISNRIYPPESLQRNNTRTVATVFDCR